MATTYQPMAIPRDFIESQRIARMLEPVVGFKLIYGEEMFSGWFYVVDSTKRAFWVHEDSKRVLPCASQWPKTESQTKESNAPNV